MTTTYPVLRNATIEQLSDRLRFEQDAKIDAVVPYDAITARNGRLVIAGMGQAGTVEEALAGERPPATFDLSVNMEGQLAAKLRVPAQWLARMRAERPDIFDSTVNALLHGLHDHFGDDYPDFPGDGRRFLVRGFVPGPADDGIYTGRAFLSNKYGMIDYLDPLVTFLAEVMRADPLAEIVSTDLSETRCVVRVATPNVFVSAPGLLAGYRSPVTPRWRPSDRSEWKVGDIVSAGMKFANSETGHGRYLLVPEFTVLACTNGMTITKDQIARTHLGARMDDGVIEWSGETRRLNVELVTSMTRDAVRSFMSTDYLRKTIDEIEKTAGIELPDPDRAIMVVAKQLSYTEDVRKMVLDHFIRGGQVTAGGVLQAVTSASQLVANPDTAYDMQESALRAMEIAAKVR